MASFFDTIVAPITGSEGAAVAIVRLSGPDSWAIAASVFSPWPEEVRPRYALYGRFSTGDDGLALPFEAGHSYTGDLTVELSVHGSRAAVSALLEACIAAGARMASPGEFTERAFLNGRIDLTQAEGVRDTVEAVTQRQFRHANLLREGSLRDQISGIRNDVLKVLAGIEASVDFSDEIGELDIVASVNSLAKAGQAIEKLLQTAAAGQILRRGYRISILGRPNVGKSSLLNALLGRDRSIVTEFPGTTRDFVEERIDLAGIPCILTDTAGLRETADPVESQGVDRARRHGEAADLVWYVFDASEGWSDEDDRNLESYARAPWILANKSDLRARLQLPEQAMPISALTREGLDNLIQKVGETVAEDSESTVWINERHAPLLQSAIENLGSAQATLAEDLPFDLATVHLQAALHDLGQITGETATEDMLERIFRDFCIGK